MDKNRIEGAAEQGNVYVRSRRAGERVMQEQLRRCYGQPKLKVNEAKTKRWCR